VPATLADGFLTHPWYSPRHGTILVESLVALDLTAERASFIETSLQAGSEADARFYQRAAQLLRAYHESEESLVRLLGRRRAVIGVTGQGALVVPLVLDHAVWSRPAVEFAGRMADAQRELSAPAVELLVTGTLSERARSEFGARGFTVIEHAFERLAPELAEAAP
jgi:hypothetical protein